MEHLREDIEGYLELIHNLNQMNIDVITKYSPFCMNEYLLLIPDSIYMLATKLLLDGSTIDFVRLASQNQLYVKKMSSTAYKRAHIIFSNITNLLIYMKTRRPALFTMYSQLPFHITLENFPDICDVSSNKNVYINEFIYKTKIYVNNCIESNDEIQNFLSRFKNREDFRYLNDIFIDYLGIPNTATFIASLEQKSKERYLINMPLSYLKLIVDFIDNIPITEEYIFCSQKCLLNYSNGNTHANRYMVQRTGDNYISMPIIPSKLAVSLSFSGKKLFVEKLLDIYPQPFEGYAKLDNFICAENNPFYSIAYELYLSGVSVHIVLETLYNYILNTNESDNIKSNYYLFTLLIAGMCYGKGNTILLFENIMKL